MGTSNERESEREKERLAPRAQAHAELLQGAFAFLRTVELVEIQPKSQRSRRVVDFALNRKIREGEKQTEIVRKDREIETEIGERDERKGNI